MQIGLVDIDSKIPNLALMKISKYYKDLGCNVEFANSNTPSKYDKVFASTVFTKSKEKAERLFSIYGDKLEIGGTGYDIHKTLPIEIEKSRPDYDLYTVDEIAKRIKGIGSKETKIKKATQIVNAGMGFTSRGCIRKCKFCFVPIKEGEFRQENTIEEIINPKSNLIILNDNNLTADPLCIDKLNEIRDRKLIVDINQGIDVRLLNDNIANALSEVRHLRSIHYAWDLMGFEEQVTDGIKLLTKYIKPYRHMCFMLVGFNTTFEEDMYRFRKLNDMKVSPFVMVYNEKSDAKLKHFARWVNSRIYKVCEWEEYKPWVKAKTMYEEQLSLI